MLAGLLSLLGLLLACTPGGDAPPASVHEAEETDSRTTNEVTGAADERSGEGRGDAEGEDGTPVHWEGDDDPLAGEDADAPPPLALLPAPSDRPFMRMRRLLVPVDTPLFDPLVATIDADAALTRSVTLSAEDCYGALAVAGDPSQRIAIALRAPGDVPGQAADEHESALRPGWALVPWVCPLEAGAWQVEIRADVDGVDVEYGVFRVAETRAREVAEALQALAGRWAPGSRPRTAPHRESLEEGEARTLPLLLEAGVCYALIAAGQDSITDLDSRLLDATGLRLRQDISTNPQPVIERFCPPETALFHYVLDAYRGDGDVFWQVRVWDEPPR